MKEIGNPESRLADVSCTNSKCDLNFDPIRTVLVGNAVELAARVDKQRGHEAIIIMHDPEHPLSPDDQKKLIEVAGRMPAISRYTTSI